MSQYYNIGLTLESATVVLVVIIEVVSTCSVLPVVTIEEKN